MKIAVFGAGQIGATFAYYLGRAGHEVTMIARGARLAELEESRSIVPVRGEPQPIAVAPSLGATPFDLVLVTVRAQQIEAVLPTLAASSAKKILFLCNTFEPTARLAEAIGRDRAVFGFPMVTAIFVGGKLKSQVSLPGQVTTVGDAAYTQLFADAGIPSVTEPDMDSWLRSHVAFVIPLMTMGAIASKRSGGLDGAEAKLEVRAMREAFDVVRGLGHKVIPAFVAKLSRAPELALAPFFWTMSRSGSIRELGASSAGEVSHLIDRVIAAAPIPTPALKELRAKL